MVGWYDPAQLWRTALEVIVASTFARHADSRRLQVVGERGPNEVRYTDPKYLDDGGTFWFDFVADTGDGWNPTFAVAQGVTTPVVRSETGEEFRRGRLLVFGGDMVYPTPSKQAYQERLLGPWGLANARPPSHPLEVLAVPGNHDWYDSLISFRQIFCRHRPFGNHVTRQEWSYFAAALPHGWWIFAVDIQLQGDLDPDQEAYFMSMADNLGPGDRVVLVAAESFWVQSHSGTDDHGERIALDHLIRELGSKARLFLAGDYHHYRRFTSADGRHRITCGCGGAFLHPTHDDPEVPDDGYRFAVSYPDANASRRQTRWNLAFPLINPKFGLLTALAYLFTSWESGLHVGVDFRHVKIEEIGAMGLGQWRDAVSAFFHSALLSPIGVMLYLFIFAGFIFFTDQSSRVFRWVAGSLHAASHLVLGFLIYWLAVYVLITGFGFVPKSVSQYLVTAAIISILGWIGGSMIFGVYLLLSLNRFKRHANEAFSSLRLEDWKGFLRCGIAPSGNLKLAFVGIDRVATRWRPKRGTPPRVVETITVSR